MGAATFLCSMMTCALGVAEEFSILWKYNTDTCGIPIIRHSPNYQSALGGLLKNLRVETIYNLGRNSMKSYISTQPHQLLLSPKEEQSNYFNYL